MRLLSLEVRHWRGLDHERLEDLSPGLNLVIGPNEAGKSRLFQALRFALWESHKGHAAYKKDLQSWSSAESPWVAVELEVEERRYRIEKQYLKGNYAKLTGGGETLRNDDAEERLTQLLGVGEGHGRSELSEEDRGLWRLLWLEQGASRRVPTEDLNAGPRQNLQDRLAEEVGEVAAGPQGLKLLERAREEAKRYWTPKSGQAGGELRPLQEEEARARQAVSQAEEAYRSLEEDAEKLDRARRELASLEPRTAEREKRLEEARQRAEDAGEARRALDTQKAQLETLELKLERAEEALKGRRDAVRQAREAATLAQEKEQELARLADRLAPQEEELAAAQAKAETARRVAEKAREKARLARRQEQSRQAREEHRRLAAELEDRRKVLARAEEHQKQIEQLSRRLGTDPFTEEALQDLAEKESALGQAQARLEVASVRVEVEALGEIGVAFGAEEPASLAAGETAVRSFAEEGTLEIADAARLRIVPGGTGLGRLQEALEEARSVVAATLEELGAETMAEAREKGQERRNRAAEERSARDRLASLAPNGLDALFSEVRELQGKLDEAASLLGREAGEVAEDGGDDLPLEETEAAADAADEALSSARARRDALAEAFQDSKTRRVAVEQQASSLRRQAAEAEARLGELPPEEDLLTAVESAKRASGEALLQRKALEAQFQEAGGENAARDLEQAGQALENLRHQGRALRDEINRLEAQISVRGGAGLWEELQEARQQLAEVSRRLERVQTRAEGARLLKETLEEEYRAAQQRFTEPVRRRVEPYLRELFPGSALSVGDDWQVRGLATADVTEDFGALSAGAQEQLGILVRLALAEILAGEERLPLILDDSLVNTDAERRETLLRIFGRAASRLQVIVFTCHDRGYDALGAERIYRLPPRRTPAGS